MAILDYKVKSFSHENRHVKIVVIVYRGSLQSVNYVDLDGQPFMVDNVYTRIAKVREFTLDYDVPRDMTRKEFFEKAQVYLNDKLIKFAQKNGHTVISQQTDKIGLEPVLNEIEV